MRNTLCLLPALALAALPATPVTAAEVREAGSYASNKQQALRSRNAGQPPEPIIGTAMRVKRLPDGREQIVCTPLRSERLDRARATGAEGKVLQR